jgi:hypothetical protein
VGYSVACYTQPSSGVWHHIAVVYDKTQAGSSAVNLYLDGVLQTPTQRPYTSTNTNSFGSNPLYFFSRGGTQEYTAGEMDDLRLYNRALSATEVQQLYQGGSAMVPSDAAGLEYASTANGPAQQFIANIILGNALSQNLTASLLSTPSKWWLIIFGGALPHPSYEPRAFTSRWHGGARCAWQTGCG